MKSLLVVILLASNASAENQVCLTLFTLIRPLVLMGSLSACVGSTACMNGTCVTCSGGAAAVCINGRCQCQSVSYLKPCGEEPVNRAKNGGGAGGDYQLRETKIVDATLAGSFQLNQCVIEDSTLTGRFNLSHRRLNDETK